MLGIVIKSAAGHVLLGNQASKRVLLLLATQAHSHAVTPARGPITSMEKPKRTPSEWVDIWNKANDLYYGPKRDLKNFPMLGMQPRTPPVRFGFIPDSFFTFFYNKTGVTGPYLLGTGLLTFVLSKEYWVVEHTFTEVISFWMAMYFLHYKFGDRIRKYYEGFQQRWIDGRWNDRMNNNKRNLTTAIKASEDEIARQDGVKYLFEAKKENVDLQLEAAYRQRLAQVHTAVKKRLDYQVEVVNATRRFQHQHMVNWIVNSVTKSITPQQEKEVLSKCILDLKGLAVAKA